MKHINQTRLNAASYYSEFDLYSKADELPDIDQLRPYYQGLIDKYIPGKVKW